MNRKSLGILAIILIALMAIVATAGLDNLPKPLRNSVEAASTRVATDRSLFDQKHRDIEQALRDQPALFRTRAADWQSRLAKAETQVHQAETELTGLKALAQANRREDAPKVEAGLARLESERAGSLREVQQIASEAERWLGYQRDLPKQLAAMATNYEALRTFEVEPSTAPARKAMIDWPAKRPDLEARLASLTELKSRGEQAWTNSSAVREQAQKNNDESLDYAALFQAADQIQQNGKQLQDSTGAVNVLAGQLYVNWDKLLVDVEDDRQKVRFIRTRFADATAAGGEVTQEEKWEPLGKGRSEDAERNEGMVVAHKAAGKYDSEADSTPQAPGYAYVAPAGQANAYGSWNNGVWSWLPQYLILSHLLRGSSVPPITMGEYGSYQRARQSGQVYYGNNPRASGSSLRRTIDRFRSGNSGGGFWQERSSPSAKSGGYRGSQYQNRGSYSGSRYQSRGGGYRSYTRGRSGGFRGGRR